MNKKKMTRRDFLLAALSAAGGLTLAEIFQQVSKAAGLHTRYVPMVTTGDTPTPTPTATSTPTITPIPTATNTPTATSTRPPSPTLVPGEPRVVHVRDTRATNWTDDKNQKYYEHINQSVVDGMFTAALLQLTGRGSEAEAWDFLFRRIQPAGYQPGQKIAVKINLNFGAYDQNDWNNHNNRPDESPQPVVSMLRSMKRGIPDLSYTDVTLFDATGKYDVPDFAQPIYSFFRNTINAACPGVKYIGYPSDASIKRPTYGKDPSLTVTFGDLAAKGLQARKLADILYDATYLINMPLLKGHGTLGNTQSSTLAISGAFKNHYGSIHRVQGTTYEDSMHSYHIMGTSLYAKNHNPVVDVYRNPNIANKTMLTVANALFTSSWNEWMEKTSSFFNNLAPNSLLLSLDPVALDTVLADINSIDREFKGDRNLYFLKQAENAGLGKTEADPNASRDPRNAGAYKVIDYQFHQIA